MTSDLVSTSTPPYSLSYDHPSIWEMTIVIRRFKSGKALSEVGILAETYKTYLQVAIQLLHALFQMLWQIEK